MLLSICIPTYNRVQYLSTCLNFLVREYNNLSDDDKNECEIIIRDNCSDDNTKEIIQDFIKSHCYIFYMCNETNIGATRNFAKLTYDTRGEYVWWVGDDDELKSGILLKILNAIKKCRPTMIFLNHSARKDKDSEFIFDSCVDKDCPDFIEDGKKGIIDIISNKNVGVVLFMTSKVIKREVLLDSFSLINLPNDSLPLFVALYAATKGSLYIIKDVVIENIYGETSWKDRAMEIFCKEIPETIRRAKDLGFSEEQVKSIENTYYISISKKLIKSYRLKEKYPLLFKFKRLLGDLKRRIL